MDRIRRLVEFVGERRCNGIARLVERAADAVGIADDEGYRHRLAKSAAQAQHDAADDANLGIWEHDIAHHFPGVAADGVRGLFQYRRDDLNTSRITDEIKGITITERMMPAESMPMPF